MPNTLSLLLPQQQEKSPINTKSLLKRLYSLASHPSAAKRLGAALAFNAIYTVLRSDLFGGGRTHTHTHSTHTHTHAQHTHTHAQHTHTTHTQHTHMHNTQHTQNNTHTCTIVSVALYSIM